MGRIFAVLIMIFMILITLMMLRCTDKSRGKVYQTGVTVTEVNGTTVFTSIGRASSETSGFQKEKSACDAAKLMVNAKIKQTFPDVEKILMLVKMEGTELLAEGDYCRIVYSYTP